MTATHRATIKTICHPALAVHFCDNCGARLWGETTCRECGHEKEPALCGNTGPAEISSCGEQKQAGKA
uniref:Uncharacterized protein n=1 Tax=Desulfovibrio sp. U5L TaxID=596152 RepID=I2Q064_9BACT